MGIFDGVLLASDFDGTLTGSNGIIPQNNIDAIKYFISEGGKFSVSTGRTKLGFHNYNNEFINAPVILGNGGMAYDYSLGKIAFVNAIEKSNLEILSKILLQFPCIGMEIYTVNDITYVINPSELNFNHFKGLKIDSFNIASEVSSEMFPAVKIMLSAGNQTFEVQDYLRKIELNTMKFIPCSGSFVEILADSAGKGLSLLRLADYLCIKHENAYAVGDASNDVDMLLSAKSGFVPSSGDEYAKSVATEIVCSSDSGAVSDVIFRLRNLYLK